MTHHCYNPTQTMPPDGEKVRALYLAPEHPQTLIVDHGQWMTTDLQMTFVHAPLLWRALTADEVVAEGRERGEMR